MAVWGSHTGNFPFDYADRMLVCVCLCGMKSHGASLNRINCDAYDKLVVYAEGGVLSGFNYACFNFIFWHCPFV